MAADTHQEHAASRPAPHPPAPARHHTHVVVMTTRGKRLIETPYDASVEVEDGKAVTISAVDAMHAWLVADDKAGRAYVSVTPLEPHDDYVPAVLLCQVEYPVTTLTVGDEEPK